MSPRTYKVPRTEPCPCGSGKKHEDCCWGRDVNWRREEDGTDARHSTIPSGLAQALREEFVQSTGREPEPGDLLLPDLDPVQFSIDLPRLMTEAGVGTDEMKYASMVTGLMPVPGVVSGADEELLVEAVQEWRDLEEEARATWRETWVQPVGSPPPNGLAEVMGRWASPPRQIRLHVSEEGKSPDE